MDHMLRHGMFAPVETRLFHHIILKAIEFQTELLVIDVGMNVGYFSLLALSLGARVIAVEPAAHMIPSMRASLSLNPESFARRFAMTPCAAGSVFQTVDVIMNAPDNASNFDWAFIYVNSSRQTSSDAEDRGIIRCTNCSHSIRLDDVVKQQVLLVKLDTEGAELSTLQGLAALLEARQVLNIIAELKPPHRSEIMDMLRAYGFRCMKYIEAYDMVLPSDRFLTLINGTMAIDQSSAGHTRSIAYYGASCYESGLTSMGQAEDHWFVHEDASDCFWGDGGCEVL